MKAIIAKKIGMTSDISENGVVTGITLLGADPCVITQIKTVEKDGYSAIQVGSGNTKQSKAQAGHYKKSDITPAVTREFRLDESADQQNEDLMVGTKLTPEVFSVGDTVSVMAFSKGKGFAGTTKRHNFKLGRKTHGGDSYRRPGSIGSMYPQKVFKGKRMTGQMGHTQVTIRNLKIALIDAQLNVIGVKGAVPGPRRGIVIIRGTA